MTTLCAGPQDAFITYVSHLLRPTVLLRPNCGALPAELLPYAAAQLLPLLLLSPERVRTMDLTRIGVHVGTNAVSLIFRDRVVRPRLPALRPSQNKRLRCAPCRGVTRARAPAGRRPTSRSSWQATGTQGAERSRWRARAWCRSSRRRCTSWSSTVRASLAGCMQGASGVAGGVVRCGSGRGWHAGQRPRCVCLRPQPLQMLPPMRGVHG